VGKQGNDEQQVAEVEEEKQGGESEARKGGNSGDCFSKAVVKKGGCSGASKVKGRTRGVV